MIGKQRIEDLSIFGGKPCFTEKLHVGRPNIGDRKKFIDYVNTMFDNRWLTNNGPFVQRFEKELTDMLGVRNCIVVCNATVGLEIVTRALGLGGEIILPSFTFIATAHSLQWQGITPVFCDINPKTHNIDPLCAEKLITPRTSGILAVHVWGKPCDIDALEELTNRKNIKLYFDSAHAFGNTFEGKMIGNFGNAEVFSFHATKFFNTFEGGAITTNDDDLAKKVRSMVNFGFSGIDMVTSIGINGKMNEICAAMGITNLENLDDIIDINLQNYHCYKHEFESIQGIKMISFDETEKNNYQYIILEIDEKKTKISRDLLVQILHSENILARRYFYPGCHQMEPYRSYFPNAGLLLPETEKLTKRVMSLPSGSSVSPKDIIEICQIIRMVLNNGEIIKVKMEAFF